MLCAWIAGRKSYLLTFKAKLRDLIFISGKKTVRQYHDCVPMERMQLRKKKLRWEDALLKLKVSIRRYN
jgi:hypothetical protein